MGIERAAADHACNVVRRQIQEEFPDLALVFMICDEQGRQKAYDAKRGELREHPAAEAFLPHLRNAVEKGGPEFSGISIHKPGRFAAMFKRPKILACFFFNADRLESVEDARRHALFLAWQAITLLDDIRNRNTDRFENTNGIFMPHPDKRLRLWKNMLADAFSVLVLELDKKRDAIGQLGRLRSLLSVTARPYSNPERYPFPLVYEATRLVYNDMRENSEHTNEPIKTALTMTQEIGETFDLSSVRQWHAFCRPAQEMAWLGMDPKTILGAAVYNSDDIYARATAYLVAEALNIQTLSTVPINVYNAFAEDEINERHHLKACEENFNLVLSKIAAGATRSIFEAEALRQNQKMIAGNPLGWCVYALKAAEIAFRTSKPVEEVSSIFHETLTQTTWLKVNDILHLIVLLRREGLEVTSSMLADRLEEINDLKFLAPCFRT